ncbi:MAG: AmmeMemoRadiSam system protein B, partial [Candidatus Aerophobetes bacterium]|nr:AmmeMemoRadiSam system protein B [Candidatus Aerophobetes bacterium]
MAKIVRRPTVAGSFYEGTEEGLRRQIEGCYTHPLGPGKLPRLSLKKEGNILGLISPHAGYMYSGPVAVWGFYEAVQEEIPEVVVVLGPNHRGFGAPVAVMPRGEWETPLGKVEI